MPGRLARLSSLELASFPRSSSTRSVIRPARPSNYATISTHNDPTFLLRRSRNRIIRSPCCYILSARCFSRLPALRTITPSVSGTSIPVAPPQPSAKPTEEKPFFQTGFSLYAKRPPRAFPKPWINPPTSSFSEPLSVHSTSLSRRPLYPHQHISPTSSPEGVGGRFLRGYTNGDDALLVHYRYMAVADGVGSWNLREKGYPALWSRLLLHYFSIGCERFFNRSAKRKAADEESGNANPDVTNILNDAFGAVIKATGYPTGHATENLRLEDGFLPTAETQKYHGTTTFTGCVLHDNILTVINMGDSHCLVLRPSLISENGQDGGDDPSAPSKFLLRTTEDWHYFDCPRQLGTDSPDTPLLHSTVSQIKVENGDIVIMSSDGMLDNLWEEEVISIILKQLGLLMVDDEGEVGLMMKRRGKKRVEEGVNVAFRENMRLDPHAESKYTDGLKEMGIDDEEEGGELMTEIAAELVKAAKVVATDPYAESPWMERAINEGKTAEGGKLDDISVVVGRIVGVR